MKITDFHRAPDSDKRDLKRQIDCLPPMKTILYACELPPGCVPAKNAAVFYRDGADYAIYLDKPIRYSGDNPALEALKDGEPVLFRGFPMMMRFFEELALAGAPEPVRGPTVPPPLAPVADDGYDVDKIVNMAAITPPQRASQRTLDYRELLNELRKSVMGQDWALETVAHQTALFVNKSNPKKPLSIVAYGPPGTGKSEMAKLLSKALTKLTGRQYAVVWTDMNQLTEAHSVHRLTGSPPGYVGYDDKPVFEVVTQNPYTVFIFDELDKAHPDVIKTFMAILDEGRCASRKELPDGSREYDFKHCVIVFTSNYQLGSAPQKRIGFALSDDVDDIRHTDAAVEVDYTGGQPEDGQDSVTKRVYRETEAARKAFVAAGHLREIASRFNCFVEFQELSDEAKIRILAKQVIETGFEYNIRLTYISSSIMQALTDAATSGDALTVRSFKAVIEGCLAAAFAEAGSNYGGQAVRLDGTLDALVILPV